MGYVVFSLLSHRCFKVAVVWYVRLAGRILFSRKFRSILRQQQYQSIQKVGCVSNSSAVGPSKSECAGSTIRNCKIQLQLTIELVIKCINLIGGITCRTITFLLRVISPGRKKIPPEAKIILPETKIIPTRGKNPLQKIILALLLQGAC